MDSVFLQCLVGCVFAFLLMFVAAYQFVAWRLRRIWPDLIKLMLDPDSGFRSLETLGAPSDLVGKLEQKHGQPRGLVSGGEALALWSKVKCSRCGAPPPLDVIEGLVRDNVPPPTDISTLLCEKCAPTGSKSVMRVTCDECGFDTALPVDVPPASHRDRAVMKSVQQATNAWLRNNHWKPVLGAWQCPDCAVNKRQLSVRRELEPRLARAHLGRHAGLPVLPALRVRAPGGRQEQAVPRSDADHDASELDGRRRYDAVCLPYAGGPDGH